MATENAMNIKREKRMAAMEERLVRIEEKLDWLKAAVAALPIAEAGNKPAEVRRAHK